MVCKAKTCANGFTIIELVVTIIVVGILAATVAPRFLNSKGFEEYSYRSEVISTLRSIQLRAMQQTDNLHCHQVTITSKIVGLNATDNPPTNLCNNSVWFDSSQFNIAAYEDGPTSVQVDANHSVVFSVNVPSGRFSFDQMGRPVGCPLSTCIITITGDEALTIKVEPQGYVHAI